MGRPAENQYDQDVEEELLACPLVPMCKALLLASSVPGA